MANKIVQTLSGTVMEVMRAVENVTNCNVTTNEKNDCNLKATALACVSIIIMAILSIVLGSKRSVKLHREKEVSGETTDAMSRKEAIYFPIIASLALFGLYMSLKVFSKNHINLVLTGYSCLLGVTALIHTSRPLVKLLMSAVISEITYHILFNRGEGKTKEKLISFKFSTYDVLCLIISTTIGVWYLIKKHWIAKNVFGLAFTMNAVEILYLNNIVTGCILLSGLFFYDIFWILGSNVIVSIAKSFETPIMLVFPQDWISNGINGSNFVTLSLGDVIIPGMFIALLLRFDHSTDRKSDIYFHSTLIAYFIGLTATIIHRIVFEEVQPARLFLVPTCLSTPLLVALLRGEMGTLFAYHDHPERKTKNKQSKDIVNAKNSRNVTLPAKDISSTKSYRRYQRLPE
uniref:Minor histocompatibility antigen H13 n=1 Tax=Glossina palpalis gambiensis TaxID=67801 RepID=A0A1B0B7R9_9MUSC